MNKTKRPGFNHVLRVLRALFVSFCLQVGFTSIAQGAAGEGLGPDVIITSQRLFDLPKDVILVAPLADLFTEDFVFYYRDGGEDWLSFRGALARIAFERKTDWPLRLMSWLMNGPAELALWKGPDGKLTRYALVIDQTGVKALAKSVAEAAVSDSQLRAEKIDGHSVQVLK
ncbi:MAG: DUF2138 family protein, partial [Bdellovibrionaceae bacterium]|nr:DUF2138 family protein [Pseudobdellovibrionaceae bacterium]